MPPPPLVRARVLLAAGLLLGGGLAACRTPPPPPDVAVRVGEAYLTDADLSDILAATPPGGDSTFAREQYVEQWITNQLLADEARRRGLRDDPGVLRQLEDNETAVLASAYLSALYEDAEASIGTADLEAYYEQNRERLRLREPYVRVRFLELIAADSAAVARVALQRLAVEAPRPAAQDSLFGTIAQRFALDPSASMALSQSFVPESRLARQVSGSPWGVVSQLRAGEVSAVLPTPAETHFVVQVAERVPAGAVPDLAWVQEDVQRQLLIQHRKRVVAREVQRLRTEAEARGALRVATTE